MSLGEDELNLSNMCVDGSHAITAEYPNFDSSEWSLCDFRRAILENLIANCFM